MGDMLVFLRDGIAAWLPLFFAVLLVLMVYILWRTLQVMPRVTAAQLALRLLEAGDVVPRDSRVGGDRLPHRP